MRNVYTDTEWELLVALPRAVATAATSAESDGPRRTVSEGAAGQAGIQAGEVDDSELVRAIYGDLFLRESDPDLGERPAAEEFVDRGAGVNEVLDRVREAAAVLAAKADPVDAAAYWGWLSSIATSVTEAAKTGGFLGVGGDLISPAERTFITNLDRAWRDEQLSS